MYRTTWGTSADECLERMWGTHVDSSGSHPDHGVQRLRRRLQEVDCLWSKREQCGCGKAKRLKHMRHEKTRLTKERKR